MLKDATLLKEGCLCPAVYVPCCVQIAGEKEYYLASAFEELNIAPTANLRLAGFSVAGRQAALYARMAEGAAGY